MPRAWRHFQRVRPRFGQCVRTLTDMLVSSRQEPVRAAVWYALEQYCREDAVFLAERLHDEVGDVDSLYLLATCLYRSGRLQQAKHLLSRHKPSAHPDCDLLHARICLELDEPQSTLLVLQSFLCFKASSERDIAHYYGNNAGVAFWLLGRSHQLLHNTPEAAKNFRSCLKHNPFLWTAFEALCSMGESPSAEDCFTASEYPSFLPPLTGCGHHGPSHSHPSQPHTSHPTQTMETQRSENDCIPLVDEKQAPPTRKPTAFTPVDTNRTNYVTPDLFMDTAVGKAVASSTPFPRALAFTRSEGREETGGTKTGFTGSGPVEGSVEMGRVRMVLDFGSGPKSGGGVASPTWSQGVTPSFGAIPQPSQVSVTPAQGTPSHITPSPSALPQHYTKQLLSVPVAPKKRVAYNLPPPSFQFSPEPDLVFSDPQSSNQISPSWSTDAFSTPPQIPPDTITSPPVAIETKPLPLKTPLKSALRRSERLRKTNLLTAQRKVGISGLVHSNKAAKLRMKSSLRDGEKSPRKGLATPLMNRGSPTHRLKMTSSSVKGGSGELVTGGGGEGGRGRTGQESLKITEQQATASIAALMKLLQQIGAAYHYLHSYDLVTSLKHFRSLPPQHSGSCWVLSQMARAYHAGERYREAAKLYREVHSLDPHRQEGMEYFASCLWHLRCEVELSVVTETLLTSDPTRIQGMCAKASSLNLARDHEGAVKCLQKAIAVSPRFAYAHTLLGHEYLILKDFEKALSAFQTAVSLDPRHYNAWYGMAHVCFSQERFKFAEVYIRRALSVNKCSSICCTQLALVHFCQKNYDTALQLLDKAAAMSLSNPIPRFHRAKVLEAMGQWEEALKQLEELSHHWPKEPNIYISKGKLLKKLKRPHEAVLNLSWALDFSRSGGSCHIREEVDQLYQLNTVGEGGEADLFIAHSDTEEEGEEEEEEEEEG